MARRKVQLYLTEEQYPGLAQAGQPPPVRRRQAKRDLYRRGRWGRSWSIPARSCPSRTRTSVYRSP